MIELKEVENVKVKSRGVAQNAFFNIELVLFVVGIYVIFSVFNIENQKSLIIVLKSIKKFPNKD